MNPDTLPPQSKQWLTRLCPFQQGGLESLIKAVSGLSQVGPKPELAPNVSKSTWPQLRQQLLINGLLKEETHPYSQVPYLRFSPELCQWLSENADTAVRLTTRRQHQRHYFQFCGQLGKQQRLEPNDALALAALEMPNLLTAVYGVIEQGEEWGLEFAQRLLPFLLETGQQTEHQRLSQRAEKLAQQKGSEPWQRHHSNLAQGLYDAGEFKQAEQALLELIQGLDDQHGFEQSSSWARIGICRGRLGKLNEAELAYRQADQLAEPLPQSEALLEMRRAIALDLSQICQAEEAAKWLEAAIGFHSQTQQTRKLLEEYRPFMQQVEAALKNHDARPTLLKELQEARKAGWNEGADAIEKMLAGETRLSELSRYLDLDDAALIHQLLNP